MVAGLAVPAMASTGLPLWHGPVIGGGAVSPLTQALESAPPLLVADSQSEALLVQRIQQLEQSVRDLTGQVQGLQFQMTQMQKLIERNDKDTDFRLKALEDAKGGARGKTEAGTQSGGAMPAGVSPQGKTPDIEALPGPATASGGLNSGDGLGPSLDPLVGKGRPGAPPDSETVPLGTLPANALDQSAQQPSSPAVGDASSNGEAASEYKAGYDAIVSGDYAYAEAQFADFVKRYPNDPKIADAVNWLGEAQLRRNDYVDAADTLVNGYKKYMNSPRAPDMLLNLGIAFAGAKQPAASCKTFGLLNRRYPDLSPAFKTRIRAEMGKAGCPS